MTKDELVDAFMQLTFEYTDSYFSINGLTEGQALLDKQLWGALHVGFVAGLKIAGYEPNLVMEAHEECLKRLKEAEDKSTENEPVVPITI